MPAPTPSGLGIISWNANHLPDSRVVPTFGPFVMNKPTIIAYLKPTCGWSQGVRAVMRKYDLPYQDRDIINDPAQREEMIRRSGQPLSPCVEVNGHMLADVSGAEVEAWLLENGVVQPNAKQPDFPVAQGCVH